MLSCGLYLRFRIWSLASMALMLPFPRTGSIAMHPLDSLWSLWQTMLHGPASLNWPITSMSDCYIIQSGSTPCLVCRWFYPMRIIIYFYHSLTNHSHSLLAGPLCFKEIDKYNWLSSVNYSPLAIDLFPHLLSNTWPWDSLLFNFFWVQISKGSRFSFAFTAIFSCLSQQSHQIDHTQLLSA